MSPDDPRLQPLSFTPIGILRTPFPDRVSTPRQPHASEGAEGRIELAAGRGLEHAVSDLEGWEYLWVIFCFHLNKGWRPKVLPPRSAGQRRGVLATRSPHRPNPIGLSLVRLVSVEGLVIHVRDVDMIDESPVLDIKPYIPYAEARPGARTGWLEPLAGENESTGEAPADPEPGFSVTWSPHAAEQAAYLKDEHGIDLVAPVTHTLRLGPQPHPYRRIRALPDGTLQLAHKDFRIRFRVERRDVTVLSIGTGYRERDLALSDDPAVAIHRAFNARFPPGGEPAAC
ncbi:tRNA (N6-threonylcarbamoyladenosine(37)-N6)-methyltransferase TrmO [Polyangium jinanense]|uniref:tRNA (N6-threonylcarbamoyladenosine(37)-N6)-methyltransferase TrmO n=1 Tax=Polyangium jinanense TaxID=2829994 RepID=A0A9X4AT03_9BACT|nr:tRNA (N6-threonylcarbamoyladenosine(37)-N6)-methyltransferase TrmO [Polyangium jinanense]MDC3958078.1 tRNA (N6-threonylcarbamoyladenosine(37)-N6)-methyltransferase TrmO [Polyangium jinanense]MDC3983723.1 tRNA (N6-threonylcarbamoyladenosine(37)-N6)-methyltransferase TrmO [Polyangium jinanense]